MIRQVNSNSTIALINDLAQLGGLGLEPRQVDSVAAIFGGFGQDKILIADTYEGKKCRTNGPHLDVMYGESEQAAEYLFQLENRHGDVAPVY